jgi:hypothetical protein
MADESKRELIQLARQHADDTRPRQRGGKWSWTEALGRAPWGKGRPEEHEEAFRRAYAERLVELGLALPVGRSRTSGPSGKNPLTEVKLRGEKRETDRWTEAAAALGVDRNTFLRRAANELTERVLRGK